jgi:hypothetical protein
MLKYLACELLLREAGRPVGHGFDPLAPGFITGLMKLIEQGLFSFLYL